MIKPWTKLASRPLGDFRIFTIRSDEKVSPRTGQAHDFFVLDCADWVNIVAVTPDRQLVMVEQYRHGSDTVELGISGGVMDPHDPTPEATAIRELREETGYEGENARIIGRIFPNPAIMTNLCFTVLIENCHLRHGVSMDSAEDLATKLHSVAGVHDLAAQGKIRHALVMVALYHFDLWERGMTRAGESKDSFGRGI